MGIFSLIKARVKKFFRKKLKADNEYTHWVNHIYDETVSWPNSAMMWANVHGFDEGPGQTYWLGIDVRSFGIRCADYLLKFRSKSLYDEYREAAFNDPTHILYKMRGDSRINCCTCGDWDDEHIFKWSDEEKSFHLHLDTDDFASEK